MALDEMLSLGVTTVEAKSGYGLAPEHEYRQLELNRELNAAHPLEIVSTFLGAHVIPDEYTDRRDEYLDLLCDEMLPTVAERQLAEFCDVFVESGAEWRESGCSMCLGMNGDTVPGGHLSVSTSNRNFEGRQGIGARTVLASPLTAAASAIEGRIADPRPYLDA